LQEYPIRTKYTQEQFWSVVFDAYDSDDMEMMLIAYAMEEEEIRYKKTHHFHERCAFNIHTTSQPTTTLFRFDVEDIILLCEEMHFPDTVTLSNNAVCTGMMTLCVFLRRLAYPCRLVELVQLFGCSTSTLSLSFSYSLQHIYSRYKHLVESIRLPCLTPRLAEFARSVHAKGAQLTNCVMFIDGTWVQMCMCHV